MIRNTLIRDQAFLGLDIGKELVRGHTLLLQLVRGHTLLLLELVRGHTLSQHSQAPTLASPNTRKSQL